MLSTRLGMVALAIVDFTSILWISLGGEGGLVGKGMARVGRGLYHGVTWWCAADVGERR